jgi:glutathione S-transferase
LSDIILHHYPQSPVSEKVWAGLGIKNATWRSVEIPCQPPKPSLMPLTGVYQHALDANLHRHVLRQRMIMRILDQRILEPAFYSDTSTVWNAGGMFILIFRLALVFTRDPVPPGFVEDRGQFYLGRDWDMVAISGQIPDVITGIEERFKALDLALSGDPLFLEGSTPNVEGANAYHLVWFLRCRWADGATLLSKLPNLLAREQRMAHIGHGTWSHMTSSESLELAKNSKPATPARICKNDRSD